MGEHGGPYHPLCVLPLPVRSAAVGLGDGFGDGAGHPAGGGRLYSLAFVADAGFVEPSTMFLTSAEDTVI